MKKLAVTVVHNATEGYGLTFAYDQRMVDTIRGRIPAEHRRFDARTKTWWLARSSDLAALRWSTNSWAVFDRGR